MSVVADPNTYSQLLLEHEFNIFFSLSVGILSTFIAKKYGFFNVDINKNEQKLVNGWNVGFAFFIFMIMQIIVGPGLFLSFYSWKTGVPINLAMLYLNEYLLGWLNLTTIASGCIGVGLYFYFLDPLKKRSIIGPKGFAIEEIWFGIKTWILAYPLAMGISEIASLLLFVLYNFQSTDQAAVKNLKMVSAHPFLSTLTSLSIMTIIPIIEETLFRGLLQSWFSTIFKRFPAILLTSIIFTVFHLSPSLGLSNIELGIALFVLSLFLGFIYERQQSLWAPIGLHSIFNAVSVMIIHVVK